MIIEKEYSCTKGKHYDFSYFDIIIEKSKDVYLKNKKHLLFSYHHDAINNDKFFPLLEKNYNNYVLTSTNRGIAAGQKKKLIQTGILGYFDQLNPYQKLRLKGTNRAGRTTKYLLKYPKQWQETISLYQDIDKIYKRIAPKYYYEQKKEYYKINKNLRIPKTNFTTITVNRNWRTATHTDKGDLTKGLSCIVCIGNKDYTGGYLGFPKQKVLVKMRPGDVIFMDAHQPHCNTEVDFGKKGVRFSLVCYIRELMKDYDCPVESQGETFYLTKDDYKIYEEKVRKQQERKKRQQEKLKREERLRKREERKLKKLEIK